MNQKLCGSHHDGGKNTQENGAWHEQLEILYFLEGQAKVQCSARYYLCEKGDIILINPCEVHEMSSVDGAVLYHSFLVDPQLYDGESCEIGGITHPGSLSGKSDTGYQLAFNNRISDNARARSILEQFIAECEETDIAYGAAVKGYLLLLFSELMRNELRIVALPDSCNVRGYDQIEPALGIISSSFTRDIMLEELANACHLAPAYFCRRFREIMGMTTTEYINECRIVKAETLLQTTGLSVSQVAERSGFSDSGYFTRIFRGKRGIAPSLFRSRHRKPE